MFIIKLFFTSSKTKEQKTIYALDRETDARLWLLCVSMAFTNILWIINLILSGIVFYHLFIVEVSKYSFMKLFLVGYGFVMLALAFYSKTMVTLNVKGLFHFFKVLQRDVILYDKNELYPYRLFILRHQLKEHPIYWVIFIVSWILLWFTISYILQGLWIEALFSTFCYGVVIMDRLIGCESLWFAQLIEKSQQRYAEFEYRK